MKLKAGDRLKGVREMMGISREDFADILDLDLIRLRNLEQKKARVAEDEFAKIGAMFPELLFWLAFEGEISLQALKNSDEKLCRLVAAKFEADQIPPGYYLDEKIK